jgi:hypothetical protein
MIPIDGVKECDELFKKYQADGWIGPTSFKAALREYGALVRKEDDTLRDLLELKQLVTRGLEMNKQVKKAAEQCGLWKALDEWSGEFGNGDVEQDGKPMLNDFVEAIIKECARFADEYVSESFGVHRDVGDEMKKHFGIGEKK